MEQLVAYLSLCPKVVGSSPAAVKTDDKIAYSSLS